ncbi:DUF4339 domain-containing protein [Flavobacterium sp. F-380]|uniref:DUF4339 domain-containing protein n=1 Tax=Flavobacterium kayseriense TaxID=2764714 RepID=A0ABR7J895_9FLAO|nr:DUF4339 domain-containing protein [Flavobacterium kayseriense]MBC5841769.1 DUF4339 domain-containing protein [Flavobacterium kayseriense]MBC5848298.1 DUF4339 domain-containing protein [Flavobacterium kayseriense]
MKTYYINNGNENGGPFTIEELKLQDISTATLVWYNGMDEWKYAGEIEELAFLFKVVPPPIQASQRISKPTAKKPTTILGLKKSHFLLILLLVVGLIFVIVLNVLRSTKKAELDERNRTTELNNERAKLERKISSEELIQEEIAKRIASENTNKYRKDSINNRLVEVKALLIDKKNLLDEADADLIATKKFKILRSEEDKSEQINSSQNAIRTLKKEIDILENELNRLYLQLETIN